VFKFFFNHLYPKKWIILQNIGLFEKFRLPCRNGVGVWECLNVSEKEKGKEEKRVGACKFGNFAEDEERY
jgi:hypothetical protein